MVIKAKQESFDFFFLGGGAIMPPLQTLKRITAHKIYVAAIWKSFQNAEDDMRITAIGQAILELWHQARIIPSRWIRYESETN